MEEEARTLLQRSHEVNIRADWVLIQSKGVPAKFLRVQLVVLLLLATGTAAITQSAVTGANRF
jgi:hypothetical protein